MRGRAPLIGSGRSLSQWEPHGLSRPLTASHNLSCDLSEPIRESDPRGYRTDFTAKRIASHGRVRSASHAQRAMQSDRTLPCEAMRLAVKSVRRARGWQHRPCAWSDSQICEAVCVRGRDRTLKSVRPWESEHGLSLESHVICLRVRSASQIWESDRPPTASQIWESDRPPTAGRPWESDPRADQAASPGRGATGPRIGLSRPASRGRPIGLSNLWGRSDSQICEAVWGRERPIGLSDRTLWQIWLSVWQIWQIRLILAKLSDVP